MHYVLEIVMPQVEDIEQSVNDILKNFSEENDEGCQGFYDWYVIGGRWAGHKLIAGLDEGKVNQFYADIKKKKITVSGLQCGKQEISPSEQIPQVDALWASYFPEYKNRACPVFQHSNNQYTNDCLYGDVLRLKDIHGDVTCQKVIIAGPDYEDKKLEAKNMFTKDLWNGVNHEDTAWDGKLETAIQMHKEIIKNYKDDYKNKQTPTDDWIAVTVDYHS